MDVLLQYQFWLGIIAGLFALRQFLVILAAEQGRKHDLVKKLYKQNQDFHISILVPFLDPNTHPGLLSLLHAIAEQEYPASKITIHLVTTEETGSELIPQTLRPNVKVWQYPSENPRYEHALNWLIDRCLAAGGNSLFVFLKSTDIIKPDFCQNIVARGFDSFAIQGYVALKSPPENLLAKMHALSTRLFNRIGNAGRYHLGLSCRLLDSGWAIKQEVLEMIPYRRGMDLDNLEYGLRLNLENFRVNWAPNVVVYSAPEVNMLEHLTLSVGAFFNRVQLLFAYGPRLLTRLVMRFDFNYLEQLLSVVQPPVLATFMLLALVAGLGYQTRLPVSGQPIFWVVTAAVTLTLNIMGLVVARCKTPEYLALMVYTPLVYLGGLLASPVGFISYISRTLSKRGPRGSRYRTMRKTRFNEDIEQAPGLFDPRHEQAIVRHILEKNAPEDPALSKSERGPAKKGASLSSGSVTHPETPLEAEKSAALRVKTPRETVKSVPLSNGKKQIQCRLKTLTTFSEDGMENYQLILEYKNMAFSTQSYRSADQAFYELQAKLMGRGLTIVTCGSCGYFYNPTADMPGALKNAGVCLFGKSGKEVNLSTDAVTVTSQSCTYHCTMSQREGIVRQWKESLMLSSSK